MMRHLGHDNPTSLQVSFTLNTTPQSASAADVRIINVPKRARAATSFSGEQVSFRDDNVARRNIRDQVDGSEDASHRPKIDQDRTPLFSSVIPG
jgi:hypothetical protein